VEPTPRRDVELGEHLVQVPFDGARADEQLCADLHGAHYDTLVEPSGFVGANNGAAGTALVIQAARALRTVLRPAGAREVRFVLFDGEEPAAGLPEESTDFYSDGLRGSRAYVARHSGRTAAMILLDYVGHWGLRLPRERSSTPALWTRVRSAARAVCAARFFPRGTGPAIVDDHTPFLRAGVPAVDLIDWSYPGHDLSDGLDKLSRRSFDAVGEIVVEAVSRLRAATVIAPPRRNQEHGLGARGQRRWESPLRQHDWDRGVG
jgi:glutaminyl-peptide cyclotransferase